MSTENWSARYVAYAREYGMTPKEMIAHDRARFPGGVMAGFIVWIGRRWDEYRRANKLTQRDILTQHDHNAFDKMIGAS